jgi:hypothetical protein
MSTPQQHAFRIAQLTSRISRLRTGIAASVLALAGAFTCVAADAATVTYTLQRTSTLTNVDDAEGRWQFDGGRVLLNNNLVGYYTRKKRVSFGIPSSVNKSSMEMTLIWASGNYNFTVQGSHSFSDGSQVGGVSGTSPGFTAFNNATFSGNSNQITITY